MGNQLRRTDLKYPELSYEIVGCAFEVFNEIGFGHKEVAYQRAMEIMFEEKKIIFKRENYYPVSFRGKIINKNFFDFLVDNKIVVELKKDMKFSKKHMDQVLRYLNESGLELAILINFGREGVYSTRIVNDNNYQANKATSESSNS
jgi:GxxExxY protein